MTASLDPAALRAARHKSGRTQGQVARALGLASGESVSEWERGTFEPNSAALLHKLADVLDIAVPDLLRLDQEKPDLRYLRLVAGLESADVAQQVHVAVSTYRRWERGAWIRMPGKAVVTDLARAFGVRPEAVDDAFAHGQHLASRTNG